MVISRLQECILTFDLSDDLNKSHRFKNFNFCDVTLYHSISLGDVTRVVGRDLIIFKIIFLKVLESFISRISGCKLFQSWIVRGQKLYLYASQMVGVRAGILAGEIACFSLCVYAQCTKGC